MKKVREVEQVCHDIFRKTPLDPDTRNMSKRLEYRWENGRNIIDIAL